MPGLTTTHGPRNREEETTASIHDEATSQQEGETLPPGRGPDPATPRVCVHVSTNLGSGVSITPCLEEPGDMSSLQGGTFPQSKQQKRKEQPAIQSPKPGWKDQTRGIPTGWTTTQSLSGKLEDVLSRNWDIYP